MDPKTPTDLTLEAPEELELEELEKRIEFLEKERLNLRISGPMFDRLLRLAEFKDMSIEEYAVSVLQESLEQQIGKPSINAPSVIGQTVQRKVMGPSDVSTVSRA